MKSLSFSAIRISQIKKEYNKRFGELYRLCELAPFCSGVQIVDEIIKDGAISDANLRLLVDNIVISEQDGKLLINIDLKAAFSSHLNLYDGDGILAAKAYAAN